MTIDRDAIYDDALICAALELSSQTLSRARRDGKLRFAKLGNRILYMGQWVTDWILAEATTSSGRRHPGNSRGEK